MNLQLRTTIWEHGFLPVQALCPQLDSLPSLLQLHTKLLEKACQTPPSGNWSISSADLAATLELTSTQLEVLCEVLSGLSLMNGTPPDRPAAGKEHIFVHELSMYLFILLFSKEAQRQADNNLEVWPEAGGPGMFGGGLSGGLDGLLSPTRAMTVRTSLSGKASIRQQLQQHLKHQTQQLRGLNDYIRRNLRTLVELSLEAQGPWTTPSIGGITPSTTPTPSMLPDQPLTAEQQQQQQQPAAGPQQPPQQPPSQVVQYPLASQLQTSFSAPLTGIPAGLALPVLATSPSMIVGGLSPQPSGSLAGLSQLPQRLVSAQEVDRLRFILQAGPLRAGTSISGLIPGFVVPGALLPMDVVVASLRHLWHEDVLASPRVGGCSPAAAGLLASPMASSSGKASRHLGLVGFTGMVDDSSVAGVYKGTVVRGESDVPQGNLRVTDCHDAVVYVLAPLNAAYVSCCSETTVVVGAAGGLVRLERCEKVTLIALAARVVVSNCHDCLLHLGTPRQPMLIGDCRFVRLAPYNTRYERQLAHVRACGVRLDAPNRWDAPLVLVAKDRRTATSANGAPDSPRAGAGGSSSFSAASSSGSSSSGGGQPRGLQSTTFSLLQPDEILPFVIPFQGTSGLLAGGPAPPHTTSWRSLARASGAQTSEGGAGSSGWPGSGSARAHSPSAVLAAQAGGMYLYPLPPEYERSLHRKLAMTAELRQRFKQAGLSKEREAELNNTIQAYFKDWLSSSSMLRQIYDLSNLEKEGEGPGGLGGTSGSVGGLMTLGGAGGSLAPSLVPDLTMPPPNLRDRVSLNL